MAKQSKNKVKLEKKYKAVGRIPLAAIREIRKVMPIEESVQSIRANTGNTVKHNHKHIDDLEAKLAELGLTKENYAEFVARNFNEIHRGKTAQSLLLAVANEDFPNHVAAVHLHYEKKENFWLVTSVHAIRPDELERIPLIWKK
ncbi:MAG: hypothetical protein IKM85_06660 [Bacteroidales bacterium]|nr:hypothetical protein [Bacteroidales bacterium]